MVSRLMSMCLSVHQFFSFADYNFSTYQWIFTKLSMCIAIVEICFGNANGQISSIFDIYLTATCLYCFWRITSVNINRFSPNLVYALILWRFGLGLLMCKLCQFLTVICPPHISIFIYG